jgi:cleavage stimulation factor subunit 1
MATSASSSAALYRLCVAQLHDDGYPGAAQALADATSVPPPVASDGTTTLPKQPLAGVLAGSQRPEAFGLWQYAAYKLRCVVGEAAQPTARFSADGRHVAVGASDGSVRVFEASSLLERGEVGGAESPSRHFGVHSGAVNDVDFHPSSPILVSASEDATLQFYDFTSSRPEYATRPMRTCTDTHPARCAAFHPKGEHLLVGTTHAALHLYDTATFRCFLSPNPAHHHRAAITDARWAADGSLFASCASAEVKLWDGSSCLCVATLGRPHGGTAIGSVAFSRSGRYLLTSGADSAVKLWDVRAIRTEAGVTAGARVAASPVRTYEGGGASAARRTAAFSHDEAVIVGADEASASALVWSTGLSDAHADAPVGGEVVARCSGHSRPIRCVAHSPTAAAFVTCADDATVRVWQ